jgi:hypothetical protein
MQNSYLEFSWKSQTFTVPSSKLSNPRIQALLNQKNIKILATQKTLIRQRYVQKRIRVKPRVRKTPAQPSHKQLFSVGYYKRRRLPKGRTIQERRLRGMARKYKVPSDIFDFGAEINGTLTYAENKRIIEKKIGKLAPIENKILGMDIEGLGLKWEAQRKEFLKEPQINLL